MVLPPPGPALLRLLHPVLAEKTVAGGKRGVDPVIGLALADRHQRRRRHRAVRSRFIDPSQGFGQIAGDVGRKAGVHVAVTFVCWGCSDNDIRGRHRHCKEIRAFSAGFNPVVFLQHADPNLHQTPLKKLLMK